MKQKLKTTIEILQELRKKYRETDRRPAAQILADAQAYIQEELSELKYAKK